MPWNENSNGGGPWGQGPSGGGRGSGPQPPDLEELLKRGQDRFKNVFPGGNMGGSTFAFGFLVLLALWGVSGFYTVQPDEKGIVLRFGEYVRYTGPGLSYHLPYPIESVEKPRVTSNNQIQIGVKGGRDIPQESLMLTGDENIVNIHFSVFWQISPSVNDDEDGAAAYLFNVQDPDRTVKAVAESSMREVVGSKDLEPIITRGREIVETETVDLIQRTLDAYGAGILITQVQLQKADPPDDVIESFRDVVAARQDQDRKVNEARAYANKIVPEARGEAQRIIQQAEAYRAQTAVEANGEATRFNSIYKEYKRAPEVTRERMFLETMERVLRGKSKVVIDDNSGSGVVPYLPLPELQKRNNEGAK